MEAGTTEFYDAQKELIDICIKVLSENLEEYRKDERFRALFYDNKKVPSHVLQPLQATRNKITFKPVFRKIEEELEVSKKVSKRLVSNYGYSFILENLERIKDVKKMRGDEIFRDNLYDIIKS